MERVKGGVSPAARLRLWGLGMAFSFTGVRDGASAKNVFQCFLSVTDASNVGDRRAFSKEFSCFKTIICYVYK